MRRTAVPLTLLAVVLSGCASPTGSPRAESTWQPPDRYAYTLDSGCGEQFLIGQVRLWVDAGAVVAAQGLDEPGERLADSPLDRLPTLATLLGYYNEAVRGGADRAELATDSDGHPTRIDIDHSSSAIDDESCFVISDYEVGATAPD